MKMLQSKQMSATARALSRTLNDLISARSDAFHLSSCWNQCRRGIVINIYVHYSIFYYCYGLEYMYLCVCSCIFNRNLFLTVFPLCLWFCHNIPPFPLHLFARTDSIALRALGLQLKLHISSHKQNCVIEFFHSFISYPFC